MIEILEYTTETVSKYWDSDDYRLFTLKMTNNNLTLINSNSTNSRLYGITESGIGKSLYEIMEKEHADRWHARYHVWKKSRFTSYIAYFEDASIGWDTTIEVVNDTVFGIGKKVDSNNLNSASLENHEIFNHYFIHQEDFIVITLLPEANEEFIIESIDSNLYEFESFIGQDISAVTLFCSNILDKGIYKKCMQTKKIIQFVEKVNKDNITLFLNVNIYPYLNNSKIVIYARIINEALYNHLQRKISNIYGEYPETDYLGICEINYEDEQKPYLIGCNDYFKSILEQTSLELSVIICSSTFQKCLSTLSTETGDLSIHNDLGESNIYKLSVTHVSEVRNKIFIITLLPVEKEFADVDFSFSNLSNREKEILTYVANGLTNRYIAKILNVTEGTVKKTIYNGYKKLGICSRVELVNLSKGKLWLATN